MVHDGALGFRGLGLRLDLGLFGISSSVFAFFVLEWGCEARHPYPVYSPIMVTVSPAPLKHHQVGTQKLVIFTVFGAQCRYYLHTWIPTLNFKPYLLKQCEVFEESLRLICLDEAG